MKRKPAKRGFLLLEAPLERQEALKKYRLQVMSAMFRGIEWKFTFESWLEWWGADLDRRGTGSDDLCMMRPGDVGPYSPENTRKGTNRQNAKSRGINVKTKRAMAAYRALQDEIDRTPAVSDDEIYEAREETIAEYMSRDHDGSIRRGCKWDRVHR